MSRACIIIPYYGKWPPYLNLFLKSCSFNPELTVLVFSDLAPPAIYPDNVKFHSYNLSQIKSTLDGILQYESALTTPYKLCDIRPAYGLIFEDFIKEFEFWGWGDIDLIFGSVKEFDLNYLFGKYDVISFRKRWLSGSFCLIKNNEFLNRLFLTSKDIRKIFSSPVYLGFDEISLCWEQIRNVPFDEMKWPNDNFTRIVTEASKTNITSYFNDHIKESIPASDYLVWHNGRITDKSGKPYSHYHFIAEKRQPYFTYPNWGIIPEKFYINRAGFYTENEFGKKWIEIKRLFSALPKILMNYAARARNFRRSTH